MNESFDRDVFDVASKLAGRAEAVVDAGAHAIHGLECPDAIFNGDPCTHGAGFHPGDGLHLQAHAVLQDGAYLIAAAVREVAGVVEPYDERFAAGMAAVADALRAMFHGVGSGPGGGDEALFADADADAGALADPDPGPVERAWQFGWDGTP